MKVRPWIWWLWVAVTLIFGGLSLQLAGKLRTGYEQQLSDRIWPRLARPVTFVISGGTNFDHTVLLFGDSRIQEWKIIPPAGIRIINAGMPGATTAELRFKLPEVLDEFQPDCLVLQAGINDLKLLGIQPGISNELTSLVFTNLVVMADLGRAHHCQVILTSVWPVASPELARWFVWNQVVPDSIDVVNQQLFTAGPHFKNIQILDLFSEPGISANKKTYRDALHLRPETYGKLTPLLNAELEKLLSNKPATQSTKTNSPGN